MIDMLLNKEAKLNLYIYIYIYIYIYTHYNFLSSQLFSQSFPMFIPFTYIKKLLFTSLFKKKKFFFTFWKLSYVYNFLFAYSYQKIQDKRIEKGGRIPNSMNYERENNMCKLQVFFFIPVYTISINAPIIFIPIHFI